MSQQDIDAAAERLRHAREWDEDKLEEVYGCEDAQIKRFDYDADFIVEAYLAEHPEDDGELVGNGGEREMDDEWLEDTEWLESAGFEFEVGYEPGDRAWYVKVATGIRIAVFPSGSVSLLWKESAKKELHLGIQDDATKGDVRRLCRALGVELKEASPPSETASSDE